MHRCLQIAEIVSQIFSEIDGHVYDTRMRYPTRILHREADVLPTLAGLARTCQTFKEPALDVLWREIPDLFVLVKHLMPEELLLYDRASNVLLLQHEPGPDVWRRLDPYIARIRAIGIPSSSGVIPRGLNAETVLRPLERHLSRIAANRDVLFPKLEHVVYQAVWTHETYSRLLLHPYIQVLQLPLKAYTSQWCLTPLAPVGEASATTIARKMRVLGSHIRRALSSMQQLRTLWTRTALLDDSTFEYLGSLPTLTELELEGIEGWGAVAYYERSATRPRAFVALRELSLSIAYTESRYFLQHSDPECLEAVNIRWENLYADGPMSGATLRYMLTLLSHQPQLRHFRAILDERREREMELEDEGPGHEMRVLKALADAGRRDLEPALSFTALRTLEIGIDVAFQVNDAFLTALAEKLPHLESLRLTPLPRGPFPLAYSQDNAPESSGDVLNIPNLDGLLRFVEQCTRLTKLSLVVRSTFASYSALGDTSFQCTNCVRTLELWATALDTSIPDAAFVTFFADSFPCLEQLMVVVAKDPKVLGDKDPEPITRKEAHARWEHVVGGVFRTVAQPGQGGRSLWWEVI